jgi:hypothetical protein
MSAEVSTGVRFAGRSWEPDFHIAHYVDGVVLCLDCAVACHKCGDLQEGVPVLVRELSESDEGAVGVAHPEQWQCEGCAGSLFDHFVNGLELVTEDFSGESELLGGCALVSDLCYRLGLDVLVHSREGYGIDESTLSVGDGVANMWHETFTGTTDEGRSVSSLSLALLRLAVTVHCADNDGDIGFRDGFAGFTRSALAFLRTTAG